jgi:hypothetical protein
MLRAYLPHVIFSPAPTYMAYILVQEIVRIPQYPASLNTSSAPCILCNFGHII